MKKQKFKMSKVICKQCGKNFEARTADIKRGYGKCCSISCGSKYAWSRTALIKICNYCGVSFKSKRSHVKYCSSICRSRGYKKFRKDAGFPVYTVNPELIKRCNFCNTSFTTRRTDVKYCSRICRDRSYRKRRKDAGFRKRSAMHNKVYKALNISNGFNLKCFVCNWDLEQCDLHHITPKSQGGTDSMSNLTVLCPNCHRLAHAGKLAECTAVSEYKKGE